MATSTLLTAPQLPPKVQGRSKQTSLCLFRSAARPGCNEIASAPDTVPVHPSRGTRPDAPLVGIARLAASSPLADAKRGTEYFQIPVRTILNHCDSDRVPFNWTINPYRGCEFGCQYCYARYTHEFMELDGGDFEKKIYAKQSVGELFERDIDKPALDGEHIAIGTATDPYQPAERDFHNTRSILERAAKREGLSLSITTKSDQIVHDLDLLRKISEKSSLSVNISITTIRTRLARLLEPRAPRPDLRLKAVKALRDAGIAVGVLVMPVIPRITDREADLERLAKAASEAGAQWFARNVLFLMPAAQKQFLPFVAKTFPRLAREYQEWYGRNGGAPESYKREITKIFGRLHQKYKFEKRPINPIPPKPAPQLHLNLFPAAT
jgi:DNA repair photolyase